MKLLLLTISATLILYGLLNSSYFIIVGAILFFFTLVLDLFIVYRLAKEYVKNSSNLNPEKKKRNLNDILAKWVEGIIIIMGIIMFIMHDDTNDLLMPASIIWIGEIFIYFIGGIIIQNVAGIPLRFGYGGWQVYRKKKL